MYLIIIGCATPRQHQFGICQHRLKDHLSSTQVAHGFLVDATILQQLKASERLCFLCCFALCEQVCVHAWLCVHIFVFVMVHILLSGNAHKLSWYNPDHMGRTQYSILWNLWIGLYFFRDFYISNRVFQMNNFASA